MKFSAVLALITTAVTTMGYKIPMDVLELPEGGSTITFDGNGNAIVTPMTSVLEKSARTRRGAIDKLDTFPGRVEIGCGGLYLDPGTEHGAWRQGVDWCNDRNQIGDKSIKTWVDTVSISNP